MSKQLTGDRLKNLTIKGKRLNELPQLPILDTMELQGDLKDLPKANYEKLVKTHLKHGIFLPFYVWESPEGINYIADGHQRRRVLPNEGYTGNVPVVYIEAANRQEAKEKLLVISSQYGKITQEGFDEFTFDLPDIGDIVHFDALAFEFGQGEDEESEQGDAEPREISQTEAEVCLDRWKVREGQVWEIGRHKIGCLDSSNRERVLQIAKRIPDVIWADAPYGMDLDTDWSGAISALKMLDGKGIKGGRKYNKVHNDDRDFNPSTIPFLTDAKEAFLWGADYYAERIEDKNNGSWIVWDKRLDESADKMFGSCFELCWSKNRHKRDIARIKWAGVFGVEQEPERKRFHPTQKPVALFDWFSQRYMKGGWLLFDPFIGSGQSVIGAERRGDLSVIGFDIDPLYIAVTIQRWVDLTAGTPVLLER